MRSVRVISTNQSVLRLKLVINKTQYVYTIDLYLFLKLFVLFIFTELTPPPHDPTVLNVPKAPSNDVTKLLAVNFNSPAPNAQAPQKIY